MLTDYNTVKISGLPQVISPQPTDEMPMNNAGQTRKANPSQLSADYKNLPVMPTIEALGNRSYKLTFASVDYSQLFSPGARLRAVRSVAAQILSASLNGTNQLFSKTGTINGVNWTDDFFAGAWIKLTSYPAGVAPVISRTNGTSGWSLWIDATGTVVLNGRNGSAGNFSRVVSHQSVPLNKWVHVAAQLDMSAFTTTTLTSYVMIDGADVSCAVSRAGTNPTALVQAGDMLVGSIDGVHYLTGKVAQAFAGSAKVTQVNLRTIYSQGITPALIALLNIASAYSFDGNSNDLNTTNANNLTAQNGASSNGADGPFGCQAGGQLSSNVEFAIATLITKIGADTIVYAQSPEGGALPTSGGLSSIAYASVKVPYGFPASRGKWKIAALQVAARSLGGAASTWYEGMRLTIPAGEWVRGYRGTVQHAATTVGDRALYTTMGETSAAVSDDIRMQKMTSSQTTNIFASHVAEAEYSVASQTINYFNARPGGIAANSIELAPVNTAMSVEIYVENALL